MKTSLYCKAYPVKAFRAFAGWREAAGQAKPEDGAPRSLDDDSVLFLHDDLSVTDGIFPDQHVIFAGPETGPDTGPETNNDWRRFCETDLGFAVPPELLQGAEPGD
jgi:hypothetical protein